LIEKAKKLIFDNQSPLDSPFFIVNFDYEKLIYSSIWMNKKRKAFYCLSKAVLKLLIRYDNF
jgi:hypothetical protein